MTSLIIALAVAGGVVVIGAALAFLLFLVECWEAGREHDQEHDLP